MDTPSRRSSARCFAWVALAALAISGCWGDDDEPLYPVAGRVSFAGRPLSSGTVSFRPDAARGNASLHQPTGAIDSQGHYEVFTTGREGAPAGWYKVVVFAHEPLSVSTGAHPAMPKSIIPERYNHPVKTPLSLEVKPHADANSYDLRLEK